MSQPKRRKIRTDNADAEAVRNSLNLTLDEFFDGYIVIGFTAGKQLPILMSKAMDHKTAAGLRALLNDFIQDHQNGS
jgi:hypothetical protein